MRPMDIAAYLQQQKRHIGQEARFVRDFSVFDFDYIPKQPLMREESKLLIDDMLRFEISGIPTHYAIVGSRGSGKTLTLKYLQRVIPGQTKLSVAYANCRQQNTIFKILAHLLGVQARGASLSELFSTFCGRCTGKTVIVLDDGGMRRVWLKGREKIAKRYLIHTAALACTGWLRAVTLGCSLCRRLWARSADETGRRSESMLAA